MDKEALVPANAGSGASLFFHFHRKYRDTLMCEGGNFYIKKHSACMPTHAKEKYVAGDRGQRENVLGNIFYFFLKS